MGDAMSQENVERTRRAFEAIARGDFAFVQELMAPDVVIVQPPEVPDAKTYEGRDAVMRSWEDWPHAVGRLPHGARWR